MHQIIYFYSAQASNYAGRTYNLGSEESSGYGEGGSLSNGTSVTTSPSSSGMM
ncbi:MAG: hypothetical protein PUB71_07170 [Hallerella succinigenes]|uniref:hypothetical protein n=1 Tax=Hallerella succinigenes TaxID=1896222 RepID=UPI0023EFABBA|nr:hypothetical protein [Hallerella succinigenes]MDD6092267.1 hypothetical protein [Hallerella succinigenes]